MVLSLMQRRFGMNAGVPELGGPGPVVQPQTPNPMTTTGNYNPFGGTQPLRGRGETTNRNISPEASRASTRGTQEGVPETFNSQEPFGGRGAYTDTGQRYAPPQVRSDGESRQGSVLQTGYNPQPGGVGSRLNSMFGGSGGADPGVAAPTSLQTGGPNRAAEDTIGSKLVEQLLGARQKMMQETSGRLADHGFAGGQAAGALMGADQQYMHALSQGLGDFNIDRQRQLESVRAADLDRAQRDRLTQMSLELQRYGIDESTAMQMAQLAQQGSQFNANLGFQEGRANAADAQFANQFGLSQNQFAANHQLGLMGMNLQEQSMLGQLGLGGEQLDTQRAIAMMQAGLQSNSADANVWMQMLRDYFGNQQGLDLNVR